MIKKNLLKTLMLAAFGMLTTTTVAQEQTGAATVKMTYVDQSNPDQSMGEIAAGSTATAGYNKISGGEVGFGNTGWNVNYITYLQVDASALEGTIVSATLTAEFSGSTDSKRKTSWGVGYNSSAWSADMTYNTADKSITLIGSEQGVSTKSASTFESLTFDITDALVGDDDKVATIVIYETAAAGGYIKNPTVQVTTSTKATANYTVKFVDGNSTELKEASTRLGFVGEAPTIEDEDKASFFNDDNTKKYIYVSDDAASQTVAEGGSTIVTVTFREAATYAYTINASVADQTIKVGEGSNFEGESVKYNYPRYINVDGTLYEIAKNGSTWYQNSFSLDTDNKVVTVEGYNATDKTNVTYFSEAEDIETLTLSTAANSDIRMSMGKAAYNAGTEPAVVATLPAGKYVLTSTVWGSAGTDFVFKAGDETVLTLTTSGSSTDGTGEEFTLNAETDITLDPTDDEGRGIDYVLIQKTGDVEQTTPTYAVGKLDFATIEDLSSSSIVDNTLTLEADEFTATFTGNVSYREFNGKKFIQIGAGGCNLVVAGKDGKRINRVVFTSSSNFSIKAQQGTLDGKIWTGDEEEVTFTNGAFDTEITGITVGDYVEPATDVENIGALKGIATGTNVNLKLNGAVVTFVKDNLAFIEDETGAIKLNNIGLSLTAGTALNGNLYATYTGGSIPSLGSNAQTATSEFTSEETTVTPTLATVQGLNGMMYTNRLIKLVGSMSVSGNWLMFGGTSVWIDDNFNVLPDGYEYPSEIGSLLAIGGSDGAAQEIYPVSAEDIIEPANVQPEKAANIAALRDMPGNIAVELTLTNAKVTVDETVAASGEDEGGESGEGGEPDPLADEGERTIIVEDATGAVAISADVADALSTVFTGSGIALNGSLTATLANTGGDISLSANDKTASSTVTSAAAEVMPTEMSVAESMVEENSLRLVKYVGATISGDATAGYTVTQPEAQIPAQVAMVDKFKKLAEVPTEAVDLTGVIYYDVYVGNFEFWPLSYTEPVPEQVYKQFTKSEVFLPTAENVTAAVAEGWVEHGGNYTDKKGTIDPATGETVEPQNFPGVGLKKGNAAKSFVTYVTGIDELTAYGVTGNSSDPRTLVVTATPTDGSEAVIGQATSEPNTAVVTLTLDPTKQYAVDYTGINATGEGADVALHGVKFTVTASEPQEHRKWDFTAWSQETKDNLEAEFQAAGYTTAPAPEGTETGWRRYEKDGAAWTETDGLKDAGTIYWYGSYISEPTELKANGVTIAETKGLKFNNVTKLNNTFAIAIDYPETSIGTYDGGSYIWLNGGDLQITIPAVAPGQVVMMDVESHKDGDARGVSLSVNGTQVGDKATPSDGKQTYKWTIPTDLGTDIVDVLVSSTSGCHIYSIEVGDEDKVVDGITNVNAGVKRVDNNVYTINGVMVRKAGESLDGLAKGLYIVGGKKVVVK